MAAKAKSKSQALIKVGAKQLKSISAMHEGVYSQSTGFGLGKKNKLAAGAVAEAPAIYNAGLGKSAAKTHPYGNKGSGKSFFAPTMKPKAPKPTGREEERQAGKLIQAVENEDTTDINALCDTYGLKRDELGRLTGFSLRALAEWSAGNRPSAPAKRRLREVRRLLDSLSSIVQVESIPGWLHRPNPVFEQHTPLQVIEVGETDRLWQMVHSLGSSDAQ